MIAALWIAAPALAISPEDLVAKVEETAAHREARKAVATPTIPASAYERAASGKVATGLESVEGANARIAWGVGVLAMPIGDAQSIINDELRHPGYTALSWNELVSGKPCESGRVVLQYMDVPIVWDRWWLTTIRDNDAIRTASDGSVREIYWQSSVDESLVTTDTGKAKISGAVPIEFSKGGWLLVELSPTETLLEYHVWTDPGGRLPAGPASSFAAGGISDLYPALEKLVADLELRCPK